MIRNAGAQIDLEVDGGIKAENIALAAKAGANVFVAGSAVFGAADKAAALQRLRTAAMQGAAQAEWADIFEQIFWYNAKMRRIRFWKGYTMKHNDAKTKSKQNKNQNVRAKTTPSESITIGAVSYTHLDVYKRQVFCW